MRKREIKIIVRFRSIPTWCVIENSKQIAKKFKKFKNIVVASFQVKIGRKRLRKREIKITIPFHSYPRRERKFQKNGKKIQKSKNTIVPLFQAKIGRKRLRKRESKNYPSVPFLPEAWKKIPKKWQKN